VSAEEALEKSLTERLAGAAGVRGIFPQPGLLATVAALVPVPLPFGGPSGDVQVQRVDGEVVVQARLATDLRIPSAEVVAAVRRAVMDVLGGERCRISLQLCHID
jgi:hypothetical protein